jgi:hypothetical protein
VGYEGQPPVFEKRLHYQVGEVLAVAECYRRIAEGVDDLSRYMWRLSLDLGVSVEDLPFFAGWRNKLFVRASDSFAQECSVEDLVLYVTQDLYMDYLCSLEGLGSSPLPEPGVFYKGIQLVPVFKKATGSTFALLARRHTLSLLLGTGSTANLLWDPKANLFKFAVSFDLEVSVLYPESTLLGISIP